MKQPLLTPCTYWAEQLAATDPDDLSAFERVALERHIATCPTCAAIRAEYEAMGRKISQLPGVEPHPGLPAGLLKLWSRQVDGAASFSRPAEEGIDAASVVPQSMPSLSPRKKQRNGVLISAIAAVLIVAVLAGGLLAFYTLHRAQTGRQSQVGSWELIASPNPGTKENKLFAVAAISPNDAWAVGDTSSSQDAPAPLYTPLGSNTLIEHWNGQRWSVVPSPNPPSPKTPDYAFNTLNSVAAVSANDIWAVGDSSEHYLRQVSSSPVQFEEVPVGGQELIEHWDGRQWSMVSPLPSGENASLAAVAAVSKNDVWAVGCCERSSSVLIEHWDGTRWNIIPQASLGVNAYPSLNALAVVSANDIWAGGSVSNDSSFSIHPLIEHWDGKQWSIIQPAKVDFSITGLAAVSANDVWAVGFAPNGRYSNGPLIEHWDGKHWSIIRAATDPNAYENYLFAVVALSASDVWAVGDATRSYPFVGPTFIEHWDGKQWRVVKSPNVGQTENHYLFGAARIPGTDQIWTVGFYNNIQTVIEIYNP